ncbi:hypothetical protein MUK42_29503 [Musa troglodytarum]|uniref:Secreted protein n=1 Tax=Musa troglodytarum TaxID=320322 RepID=A0A9E7G1Z1_9LILI|nr:hypothetical protein MUK42_29503 [Musa troglodytarum]
MSNISGWLLLLHHRCSCLLLRLLHVVLMRKETASTCESDFAAAAMEFFEGAMIVRLQSYHEMYLVIDEY